MLTLRRPYRLEGVTRCFPAFAGVIMVGLVPGRTLVDGGGTGLVGVSDGAKSW